MSGCSRQVVLEEQAARAAASVRRRSPSRCASALRSAPGRVACPGSAGRAAAGRRAARCTALPARRRPRWRARTGRPRRRTARPRRLGRRTRRGPQPGRAAHDVDLAAQGGRDGRVVGRARSRAAKVGGSLALGLLADPDRRRPAPRAASRDLVEQVADDLVAVGGRRPPPARRRRGRRSSARPCTSCPTRAAPGSASVAAVEAARASAARRRAAVSPAPRERARRVPARRRGGRRSSRSRDRRRGTPSHGRSRASATHADAQQALAPAPCSARRRSGTSDRGCGDRRRTSRRA